MGAELFHTASRANRHDEGTAQILRTRLLRKMSLWCLNASRGFVVSSVSCLSARHHPSVCR